jgi:hypothetical protein
MQTLGLSDSTPRSESRLKSLFWPSIQSASDVDYMGAQGYWVCALTAALSLVVLIAAGHPIAAVSTALFYYLGGVGVRERSQYAATVVLVLFVADTVLAGFSIVRILLTALLLSNLRATWIASEWKPESSEAILPPRFSETWTDKFADIFPMWLWPKVRVVYYAFSACLLVLSAIGLMVLFKRHGA